MTKIDKILQQLDSMELKQKLILGFSIPLVLTVIIAITVFSGLNRMVDTNHRVNFTFQAIDLGKNIINSLMNMEIGLQAYLVAGDEALLELYTASQTDFTELVAETKSKLSVNPAQIERLEEMEQLRGEWQSRHADVAMSHRRDLNAADELIENFRLVSARTIGKEKFDSFRASLTETESNLGGSASASVSNLLRLILIDMINQETGQRGFLLTGQETSLEPFTAGIDGLEQHSNELRQLLRDGGNNAALASLNQAITLAEEWRLEAAIPEIESRREMNSVSRGQESFTAFIDQGIGKQYMENMRAILDDYIAEEQLLNIAGGEQQKATATTTIFLAITGAACSVILSILMTLMLTRNVLRQLGADPIGLQDVAEKIAAGNIDLQLDSMKCTGVMQSMALMREQLEERQTQIEARQKSDRNFQQEMDGLISAAAQGDFTQQIELSNKDAVFLELSKRLNELMVTCDSSLSEVSAVLKSIAEGDLSKTVDGQYTGSFNELKQHSNNTVTQLQDVMGEIGSLVNDASNGNFNSQISLADKQGFFEELSQDLNSLVATTNNGVSDALRMFEALAEGDLSQSIKSDYKGAFKELKDNANNTVNRISSVISDIGALVESASCGDFSSSIDLNGKTGFFRDLSAGLNKTIANCDQGVGDAVRILGALAKGDLSQSIDTDYQGSLKELKDNANNTVLQINHIVSDIRHLIESANHGDFSAAVHLDGKEGFFLELSEGLNNLMTTTDTGLQDVSNMLSSMAQGDLSERISGDHEGSFASLKNHANTTADKLTEVISGIKDSSGLIGTSTSDISHGNTELSSRTEQQAAALEETASNMKEMTDSIKTSATNADSANKLAKNALTIANEGGSVVAAAIKAMEEINESSQEIVNIVSLIDEIAFQTNLLALNAAVEAARAGENGKGFAVVASEVGTLAQRSGEAAKQIGSLIKASVHKVSDGTDLVNKSGNTLSEIVKAVKEVSEKILEISSTSKEQHSGIEQVNSAVKQMDTMTQQNAALAEEASAAARTAADEANSMVDMIGFFSSESATNKVEYHDFRKRSA